MTPEDIGVARRFAKEVAKTVLGSPEAISCYVVDGGVLEIRLDRDGPAPEVVQMMMCDQLAQTLGRKGYVWDVWRRGGCLYVDYKEEVE